MLDVRKSPHQARIKEYLASHSDLTSNSNLPNAVKIQNKEEFRRRMILAVRDSVGAYLKARINSRGRFSTPADVFPETLKEVVLDDALQLKLRIIKAHIPPHENDKRGKAQLHVIIEKDEKHIAEFGLRDYGDEFRLSHRKVDPSYRKNGIANIAMEAIEEFVKEYSRKVPGREAVIEANCGQLDVMSWFIDNGFEDVHDESAKRQKDGDFQIYDLDSVLTSLENGDGKYEVGPYLYVFPASFKGPRILKEGGAPEDVNIDRAVTIHFRKKLDVGVGNGVVEKKRGSVARFVQKVLKTTL